MLIFISCTTTKNEYPYETDVVLSKFSQILNEEFPLYEEYQDGIFSNTNEGYTVGYTIFDLTDTLNYSTRKGDNLYGKIILNDKHFYHFAPIPWIISISFIAYLEEDEIKVFEYLNCEGKGDSIEDVITFAQEKKLLNQDLEKSLRNYRDFVIYMAMDNFDTVNCDYK